jgi:hypothetical protein
MGYKAGVKIGLTLTCLGGLVYYLYKNPHSIFPFALIVGCLEALDFYRSGYNPAKMYTFKFLEWVLKD